MNGMNISFPLMDFKHSTYKMPCTMIHTFYILVGRCEWISLELDTFTARQDRNLFLFLAFMNIDCVIFVTLFWWLDEFVKLKSWIWQPTIDDAKLAISIYNASVHSLLAAALLSVCCPFAKCSQILLTQSVIKWCYHVLIL
jgi:hypothetical protein